MGLYPIVFLFVIILVAVSSPWVGECGPHGADQSRRVESATLLTTVTDALDSGNGNKRQEQQANQATTQEDREEEDDFCQASK